MVRKQFKHYVRLGILLLGIPLLLTHCQKDDDILEIQASDETKQTQAKLITKSFKEFSAESKFIPTMRELKYLDKKRNEVSKSFNYVGEEFSIDSTTIKQVEMDGMISHTFLISRENDDDDSFFENLIIETDSTNQTKSYIIKYIPDENYEEGDEEFSGAREIKILTEDTSANKTTTLTVCVTVITITNYWLCDDVATMTNCDLQSTTQTSTETCTDYIVDDGNTSGGGGGPPGGGNPPSGDNTNTGTDTGSGTHGGGGNQNSSDPIGDNEVVVTSVIFDAGIKKRKKFLKQLIQNETISNKVGELANNVNSDVSGEFLEDGARFKTLSDNNYSTPRQPSQRQGSKTIYLPAYEPKENISVHMHQTKAYKYLNDGTPSDEPIPNSPIYSDGDIIEFLENLNYIDENNPELIDDVTSLLVALKPGTNDEANVFALVINNNSDKEKALAALEALETNQDAYDDFIKDFYDDVLEEWENNECIGQCVIDAFVEFIKTAEVNGQPLGISIYQYEVDSNGNINWNQL